MRRGFTLLELVVVVIILGILATLGFTQYTKMVEKGRTAEAKMILGQIRTAQQAYNQQWATFASTLTLLGVDAQGSCTAGTHYFTYNTDATTATANRCTASGKNPPAAATYVVNLTVNAGVWAGTGGYY